MEHQEPERPSTPPSPGAADEALRRLEDRLSRASEAAERLIAQAADSVAAAGPDEPNQSAPHAEPRSGASTEPRPGASTEPPPAGWQIPQAEEEQQRGELELLMQVARSLQDLIPAELQRRLGEALRELLLALRALLDWYLERSEQRRASRAQMQDIPIL